MSVQSKREGNNPGLKFVTFEKTPVMSTYLLAWEIGDFEYVEAMTQRKNQGDSNPVQSTQPGARKSRLDQEVH
ncbi:hypothetical protein N7535_003157 [Penicillium sp. DV-2018c]|nr:hypothetical protein N7461_001151 [Penicillium sp. DV-2018c]KAJ5576231.1 hypothetical protein N7535_003157 [Penicillium sp. DV-2018c]